MNTRLLSIAVFFVLSTSGHCDPLKKNSVSSRHLKSNSVTATKVADGALTAAKLSADIGVFSKNGSTLTAGPLTIQATTVGIGVATPTRGTLEVVGNISRAASGITNASFMFPGSLPLTNVNDTGTTTSIFATDSVVGANFLALSDARIKEIQGRSDAAIDLQTLLGIEITDYRYKEAIQKGGRPQKKVIAQQVETVFPQAVSHHTDVVPDLFAKAQVEDGWVLLSTDLKAGDRVRLIGEAGDGLHEVLEVREGAFRTASLPTGREVFVFGREVDDFRTVDYEAISMLNVSATQELARRVEEKEAEVTRLTKLVETLQARDQEREERLARLETAIGSDGPKALQASFPADSLREGR